MRPSPQTKQHLIKALWIYLIAFLLLGLTFHNETKAESSSKKTDAKKIEKKEKEMIAVFETNKGTFKIKLFADKAPKTVANFVDLATGTKEWTDPKSGAKVKKPFYDGLKFH